MSPRNHRLLTFSVSIFLLSLVVGVATEQAPPGQPAGDGLIRSELSLGGRTAILRYAPDLKASDPGNKALLSAGAASARVRLGQLETTAALRIGTVDLGKQDQSATAIGTGSGIKYDLHLEAATDGWQIQVTDSANAVVGQFPLARQGGAPSSPTLIAALLPQDRLAGRLLVRWGEYQATADVQFTNPARRRIEENRTPNQTTNRTHDEDTSVLSRARLLAQRNETAFVLPKGPRMSVSFQRTFGKDDRPTDGNRDNRGLGVEGPDFARLMKVADGQIVMLAESSVPRLRTEVPLRFGNVAIAVGNQVPGFPGSYGIWLKRVGTGWKLVFNHEPDAWGSQHDPKFDAGEIDLKHTDGHAASRPFAVGIEPTAADRGRLLIVWGPHEWSVDFVVAS